MEAPVRLEILSRVPYLAPMPVPLMRIYRLMFSRLGPQHWWPAETPFEMMVGAILTQNTNWGNVEKAIERLRQAGMLKPDRIARASLPTLGALVRPAGYFRVKAKRLRSFVRYFVGRYSGDWRKMARRPTAELREELLAVHGVGPETADSILLYALRHPVFVVDAYTKRIFSRHGWAGEETEYHDLQGFIVRGIGGDPGLYNEYHALIVMIGKDFCRKKPRCESCPLRPLLPALGPAESTHSA